MTIGTFSIFVCNEVIPIHAVFQKSHGDEILCAAKLNGIKPWIFYCFCYCSRHQKANINDFSSYAEGIVNSHLLALIVNLITT